MLVKHSTICLFSIRGRLSISVEAVQLLHLKVSLNTGKIRCHNLEESYPRSFSSYDEHLVYEPRSFVVRMVRLLSFLTLCRDCPKSSDCSSHCSITDPPPNRPTLNPKSTVTWQRMWRKCICCRASSGRRVGQGKAEPTLQGDAADNKPPRTAASPR
jgi:hypothetical protein